MAQATRSKAFARPQHKAALFQSPQRPKFREIVLETCRNKIVLNLGSAEDARHFARDFGEIEVTEKPRTYRRSASVLLPWGAESLKEEKKSKQPFPCTALMELPKFRGVVRVVRDGHPQVPVLGTFELCPWDRERKRPWPSDGAGRSAGSSAEVVEEVVAGGNARSMTVWVTAEGGEMIQEGEGQHGQSPTQRRPVKKFVPRKGY